MSRSRNPRGFTLIELLVALTGGLFVSIAVFALARDASRFYQREGRLANATLGAVIGFERLRSDIARAGFLSSPNIVADPDVCSRAQTTPTLLANLASLHIVTPDPDLENTTLEANGIQPARLRLAGSYSSADEFPVRIVEQPIEGGPYRVYLQTDSGPMARLGYLQAAGNSTTQTRLLTNVFAPGRGMRIVDNEGRQHYGLISGVTVGADGLEPYVTLDATSGLVFRAAAARLCGLKGNETGATANVVNFIQYDLRNLKTSSHFSGANASYAALYTESAAPFEDDRTELVRTELDASGAPMTLVQTLPNNTVAQTPLEELVAEYAVDLGVGLTVVDSPGTAAPTVRFVASNDDEFATFTGDTGGQPERIRSVRVWLRIRSREADRETALVGAPFDGRHYRIGLGAEGQAPYARVRTLQADVMLNNHSSLRW